MRSLLIAILGFCPGFLSSSAQGCVFNNHTLASLNKAPEFQVLKKIPSPFPEILFKRFIDRIGDFNLTECNDSVQQTMIRHKSTQQIYSLFSTTEDRCDGGNSYGVVVRGIHAQPEQAIATIEDSFIHCL